ncbi:MAG: DoxX family protein [Candidatus Glassbacteria bacterium]
MNGEAPAGFHGMALGLLRIVSGLLFLQHGAQKLFGLFGGFMGEAGQTAPFFSLMGLGGVLEFFGGLAILLGFFTRPVAFILSGEMAVAYFMFHQGNAFWPIQNQGETAVLYCFVFLLLSAAGAGRFAIHGRAGKE